MYNQIVEYLQKFSPFIDWVDLRRLFISIINEKPKHIQIPFLVAEAYGARQEQRIVASGCLALIYAAVIALDDLLDGDLRLVSDTLPAPHLANLSAGLIGLSFQVTGGTSPEDCALYQAHSILADLIVNVSLGQALDTMNPDTEDAYWRVARLKSGAFFAGAFSLGGTAACAPSEDISTLAQLGETYGIMLQIHDDLRDALEVPANPDWLNGRLTLPILFANLVDHPTRERFNLIRRQVNDPVLLREAQEILIRSGAFSYGLYQIQEYYQLALEQLEKLSPKDKSSIEKLILELVQPVEELMHNLLAEEIL